VTDTATGRLYRLPPRQLGGLRGLAFLPLLAAVGVGALLIRSYIIRAANAPMDELAWAWFLITGLGWTRACYTLLSLAAAIWCGRNEIEIAPDGRVWATDRVGWLRVRWTKLKPGMVERLVVAEFVQVPDSTRKPNTLPARLWKLTAYLGQCRWAWLAPGHPQDVLTALAADLSTHIAIAPAPQDDPVTGEPVAVCPAAPVQVVVEEPGVPNRDVSEQPVMSRIVVERHADGVTVTVPPRGIWRASGGVIVIGVLFALGGAAMVGSLIWQLFQANPGRIGGEPIGIVFLLIGLGVTIGCVHFGRKRYVLAVVGDRLLTLETGPLGSRRREFVRADLLDIASGPSNVSVNNKPLPQLQIVSGDKGRVGMLTGRDEHELKWLATVLRQAMGIPSAAPEYRKPEPAAGPPKPWHRS
jgi:hypothetical protein